MILPFIGTQTLSKSGSVCISVLDRKGLLGEWQSFRYFMLKHKDTPFEDCWCIALTQLRSSYPNICLLGQTYMTLPSTTVDVEKGFSRHNLIKTSLRGALKTENVRDLMIKTIEGPELEKFNFEKGYTTWVKKRDRRVFLQKD